MLLFGLLALQGLGLSQTTLRTPSTADQQCEGAGCPGPRSPDGMTTPLQGTSGNQVGVTPSASDTLAGPGKPNPVLNPDAVPEPVVSSEFQDFVTSSVGRKLPIYGYSLFDRVPTTFAPLDRVPVTADYVIGPGDELLIRAWGQIDLDGKLVVDRAGEVFLPKVGALPVAGLKYQQLPEYFKTAMGRVFRNFDLTVSLGQLRSVQVFVVGQARRPGNYTVSSLSTLVDTLFASGGPSGSGSMRHIQLKRNDIVITEFDFYDLLLKGDKSKDVRVLPGDVMYIPPVGASIAIAGSVNVPAIYELKDPLSLSDAIEMAGGLATTADGQKAVVERIDSHARRMVEEFPLDDKGMRRELRDGDVVRIFSLSPRFENAVTLRGNVARAGRYEWHSGIRIKDVIPSPQALVTRDYWRETNSASTVREFYDRRLEEAPTFSKPAEADLRNRATLVSPEINWDYAVIQRLNPEDLTTRLIPFNLGKLELRGDEQNNLLLEPGDIITIFSQADLAVPLDQQSKFVRLEGEFATPGIYKVEPGETLRHLIERVGGFSSNAYLYGAEFTRESVQVKQQKVLDQLVEKLDKDISRNALTPALLSPEDVTENQAKLEAQRQLVDKLRHVKATGRVVLDLAPDSKGSDSLPEIALEDGDRFVVPFRPSTVEVLGAVYSESSFFYQPDYRVGEYLKKAGGTTRDADNGRAFVVRADGSVVGKQTLGGLGNGRFDALRLMPGDAIVVPERLSRGSVLRGLKDWSQVFAQFALGAAAIRVIQ